jgi:hypothetical protein
MHAPQHTSSAAQHMCRFPPPMIMNSHCKMRWYKHAVHCDTPPPARPHTVDHRISLPQPPFITLAGPLPILTVLKQEVMLSCQSSVKVTCWLTSNLLSHSYARQSHAHSDVHTPALPRRCQAFHSHTRQQLTNIPASLVNVCPTPQSLIP